MNPPQTSGQPVEPPRVSHPARVVAVTATYRRPTQLAQLLASLGTERETLVEAVVVDNAREPDTAALAARAPLAVRVVTPPTNLGCGGGVALGLQEALREPAVTHAWIFDDDAQATPGALTALLATLREAAAEVVVPLVADAAGQIRWFPGPLTEPAWSYLLGERPTVSEYRARCGLAPRRWTWAAWPSMLVTRRAVEAAGLPRDDYWFQGEDVEWSLRLSAHCACVLAPAAECRHFPPPIDPVGYRIKAAAMLQNNLFTATRLPHGRRILRHAPGNLFRFLRAQRFSGEAWALALRAHWLGGIRGVPAGVPGGDYLQQRWLRSRKRAAG